jgi:hypothetical protein
MMIRELGYHFADGLTISQDQRLGDKLAHTIGDTFINCDCQSPVDQWAQMAKALRLHGLKIVEAINEGN